jgi:shikimate kinase
MNKDKIYLVGFMGAGKSTLAKALGAKLDWRVEDIDTLVERREHLAVADIFARYGEPHFRAVERAVLADLLATRHVVIATGGGTYVPPDNRTLINRDGVSIWLDVSLKRVIERLPPDGRRPLAASRSDMERLFNARQSAYRNAHVRLDAEHTSTGELVERVLDWLET